MGSEIPNIDIQSASPRLWTGYLKMGQNVHLYEGFQNMLLNPLVDEQSYVDTASGVSLAIVEHLPVLGSVTRRDSGIVFSLVDGFKLARHLGRQLTNIGRSGQFELLLAAASAYGFAAEAASPYSTEQSEFNPRFVDCVDEYLKTVCGTKPPAVAQWLMKLQPTVALARQRSKSKLII